MIKKILVLFFILFVLPITSSAIDIDLTWDNNNPQPDGYRIYIRTTNTNTDPNFTIDYDYTDKTRQTNSNVITVTGLLENVEYAFVCRAYIGNNESPNSNEVIYTPSVQPSPVIIPGRPKSLTIVFD